MGDKIDCVMLAAGISSRMEKWKMTLPFRGSTIIECTVENALKVCSRVILITGYRASELKMLFHDWSQVEIIYNTEYEKPMFSSVRLGVSLVRTERFFIALGDMPLVDADVYNSLLGSPQIPVVIPQYRGRKGHPILLSKPLDKFILEFDENKTLRDVLVQFPALNVPVENVHILNDIDYPENYIELIK